MARSSDVLLNALRRALASPPIQSSYAARGVRIDTLHVVVPAARASDFFRISPPSQAIVVTGTTPNGVQHFLAVFDQHNRLVRFEEAPAKDLAAVYGFARGFAAYMFLNELMASDAVLPREDCSYRAALESISLPEVHDDIVSAARDEPVPDATLDAALDTAYVRYGSDPVTFERGGTLTHATLHRLGAHPPHAVVCRDNDSVSKRDVIVARFGTTIHVYVMGVYDEASSIATLERGPLCPSGVKACAHFYVWP